MPTVILFDCSLSMLRPSVPDDCSSPSRRALADSAVNSLLDSLQSYNSLEHVGLLGFSSTCNVVVPFTRDLDSIRAGMVSLETGDKTLLERAVRGAGEHLLSEFGPYAPCNVILITDGSTGASSDMAGALDPAAPVPFPVPSCIHVVLVAEECELGQLGREAYRRVCTSITSNPGDFIMPQGKLTAASLKTATAQLAEKLYSPFTGRLTCGHLSANVSLVPRPFFLPADRAVRYTASCASHAGATPPAEGSDGNFFKLPPTIEVCGFLEQSSVAGPPILARHLVLDCPGLVSRAAGSGSEVKKKGGSESQRASVAESTGRSITSTSSRSSSVASNNGAAAQSDPQRQQQPALSIVEEDSEGSSGKQPSVRVLLHASLKVEALVALVRFRKDWFGLLMSAADSKKKANLVLSVLAPGCELPWLGGRLGMLGPSALLQHEGRLSRKRKHTEAADPGEAEGNEYRPGDYLPVPPITLPSFHSQSGLTWARQQNLQSDVQKVMRAAKRLPEKLNSFLRETNRVRHTALCYGLTELLGVLSSLLMRETTAYPPDSPAKTLIATVANALMTEQDPDKPIAVQLPGAEA